jgi:hypothetical protein
VETLKYVCCCNALAPPPKYGAFLRGALEQDLNSDPLLLLPEQQLQDFLREVVGSPAVLMGNSLGSLTALIAAAGEGSPVAVKFTKLVWRHL